MAHYHLQEIGLLTWSGRLIYFVSQAYVPDLHSRILKDLKGTCLSRRNGIYSSRDGAIYYTHTHPSSEKLFHSRDLALHGDQMYSVLDYSCVLEDYLAYNERPLEFTDLRLTPHDAKFVIIHYLNTCHYHLPPSLERNLWYNAVALRASIPKMPAIGETKQALQKLAKTRGYIV